MAKRWIFAICIRGFCRSLVPRKLTGLIHSSWRRFQYGRQKRGDGICYSGHKHQRGEKVIAIVENNGYIVSPLTVAPVNRHDTVFLPESIDCPISIIRTSGVEIKGAIFNLDSGFDSKKNRKYIFNRGMKPNIKENPRNRQTSKRGRKRMFDEKNYALLRMRVERSFAWEDKFNRLLICFERIQARHLGFKLLAYTLISLREFCTA